MTFLGLGLFDPMTSDEPVDLDEFCPSASDFGARPPPVRSRTSLDLKATAAASAGKDPIGQSRFSPRAAHSTSTSLDLLILKEFIYILVPLVSSKREMYDTYGVTSRP